MIEKILEKMGIYNLFTNIIPGYIFIMFNFFNFNIKMDNIVEQVVLAYFVGLTISRIGSIILGNILLKISNDSDESYNKYIDACNKDTKIELLLQERNSCRTYVTLFIMCLLEIIGNYVFSKITITKDVILFIVLVLLIIIYSISFCKYNRYIVKRIRINSKKNNKK